MLIRKFTEGDWPGVWQIVVGVVTARETMAYLTAVRLYERLGFKVVGTVPGAFRHPTPERVGLHIMYCEFDHPGQNP